ncbi:MAG: hypothetical protein PHS02_01195 [Candidatus ainarchaeum sp.]|nr:hypothetical protein [Candidatus ainarchaeum sp.]
MKKTLAFAFLSVLLLVGCIGQPAKSNEELALEKAQNFVINDETYAFDGMAGTLNHTNTTVLKCPNCWAFTFTFVSSSGGYGNRTGQQVLTVLTPHTAVIEITDGNITHAYLDKKWNMLTETMLSKPLAAEGEFCGGIAAFQCESGLTCNLSGSYPDAGGTCIESP